MFKNISLGVYYPGDSLVHRLQARTKLLVLVWLIGWIIAAQRRFWHFAPALAIVSLVFGGLLLAGIRPVEIWRRMRLLVLLLALGAIPTLFSDRVDNPRTLYTLGPLWTSYGFSTQALLLSSALMAALFAVSLLPMVRKWRVGRVLGRLRLLFVVAVLASLVTLWLLSDKPARTQLALGPAQITYGGVWTVVTVFVVLLALFGFSLLLTMTTSPVALIEGLRMLLTPLRWFRLPVDDFSLMALLSLRFIPTILEEVELLMKAQAARGADMAYGSLRERLQNLSMLFVPLMQGVLRRASDLAVALEARGYESEGRQTPLHETKLGHIDYLTLAVIVLVSFATLLL